MNPSLLSLTTRPITMGQPQPVERPARVGLIAGWGDFPIVVARSLSQSGVEVYGSLLYGHADPRLQEYCKAVHWTGVTRFGDKLRFFKRHGVQQVTMAGKLFKTLMFRRFAWLRHLPDLCFLRYFHRHFISNRTGRTDDELLLTVIQLFKDAGIEMAAATDFAPELLVKPGILTRGQIGPAVWQDIAYGWRLAKQLGGMDVGQTVAVHRGVALAVEAVEGTDACIQRAGDLCSSGGFTVVKVAKPKQDMRFDVPTIGLGTLQTVRQAGGRVVAFEAHRTIVLNQAEVVDYANRHEMTVIAVTAEQLNPQ